jgi:ribonuclease HII
MDWLLFEKEAARNGYTHICGVDEAGRGPLAGPVCAAAVILPEGCIIEGVNDSKKLTEKKREALFDVIIETAVSCSIAFGTVEEIERDNILAATMNTMRRAVEGLSVKADFAMIDGNRIPPLDIPARCIVGGDAKSMSIAAASILAKVSRDRLMLKYAEQYPEYAFEKHKGYGTKLHVERILEYGECPIHRPSFLKKIYAKNNK